MPLLAVTDYTFDSLDIETKLLEPLGLTIVGSQCQTQIELIDLVANADYVLTQFAPIDAAVIAAMQSAKVIVRYGIGVDNVDLDAAKNKGIPVCNVPDYCVDEVADHTLALILAATRQVVANARYVAEGNWGLDAPLATMRCLKTMTVGVVGYGRIGKEVAARLQPFKCRVFVFDPAVCETDVRSAGCEPTDLETLLTSSDLITLHCPSNQATFHLIDSETIAKIKDGVILVNVARGTVVRTDDLVEALRLEKISFAALDVLETEPPPGDHPLRTMKNVVIHSHIASASPAAVNRLRHEAASIVVKAARGQSLPNVVNGVAPDACCHEQGASAAELSGMSEND
jgi:D-3-phosphoglycerate dehydrogenase